jgi:nitrate/nitrite transport system substrate-binding protein
MLDHMNSRLSRRAVLQTAAVGAIGITPALRAAVYAAGSDAPEKTEVKIGFIPLTDCASVVMASVLGLTRNTASPSSPAKKPAGLACATNW